MTLRTRIALLVAALSLVGGATAGAAAAGSATAKLTITPIGNDRYNLVASGHFTGFYWDGVDVALRLWGDDEWFDDLLYTPPGTINVPYSLGDFQRAFVVSGSVLNEDWGSDEIYVDVRLYDHTTGRLIQTIETNRLYGSWS